MDTAPFLLEILTQELPAKPFLKEFPNIRTKWTKALQNAFITSADTQVFYTPRRIVLYAENFPLKANDRLIESFGAPVSLAYENGDKNAPLTKAGLSFCYKNNIQEQDISTTQKDGKEVLYFKQIIKGQNTQNLLQGVLTEFIDSLNFGKSMRWGDIASRYENFHGFIRPVVGLCAFLDDKPLSLSLFGVYSSPQTLGHRDLGSSPIQIQNTQDYFHKLKAHKVILDQDERKNLILQQIKTIESTHHIKAELDHELLEEVVAITEYPQSILGYFESEFLDLSDEVIIISMKEHQRYFPLYKDNLLFNGFIVVSNSTSTQDSLIKAGNEKVLRARLSDAMFFYRNDLKKPLSAQGLESVVFVEGLGSLADKTIREGKIAQILAQKYKEKLLNDPICKGLEFLQILQLLEQASELCKADLLSEMVGEFPELQGIMGSYYAKEQGFSPLIISALREQYLPRHTELPSNLFSAIVALSHKLDSILSLFSIDKIPSGSKDPYALRRAANGVIKIIERYGLDFHLQKDLYILKDTLGFHTLKIEGVEHFFLERLENSIGVNPSIFRAALFGITRSNERNRDINMLISNTLALSEVFEATENKATLLSTFKRVANVCKDKKVYSKPSRELFNTQEEHSLLSAIETIASTHFTNVKERAEALFGLKDILEEFFGNVFINEQDPQIAQNRKALVSWVYEEFLYIGDIAQIAI